jgi:hypothetical protein
LLHFEGEEAYTAAQVVDIDMVGNMGSTPAASTNFSDFLANSLTEIRSVLALLSRLSHHLVSLFGAKRQT